MQPDNRFREATRIQQSFLAALEKKTLYWLAPRTPRWINSDHLTILGLLAMAGAGTGYWWARSNPLGLAVVVLCLALNWFGDSLDGTLARFRKEVAAARRVSHPNVCRVYDIAEHGGQSFITMEFIDGEDLSVALDQSEGADRRRVAGHARGPAQLPRSPPAPRSRGAGSARQSARSAARSRAESRARSRSCR